MGIEWSFVQGSTIIIQWVPFTNKGLLMIKGIMNLPRLFGILSSPNGSPVINPEQSWLMTGWLLGLWANNLAKLVDDWSGWWAYEQIT